MEKIQINRKVTELCKIADKLAYFEDKGEYSYINKYKKAIYWIYRTNGELILNIGTTDIEEAEVCLAVLVGYSVTIRNEKNIQKVLDRALSVLPKIPPSLLKCQLLVYCYAELYTKELAEEAKEIMKQWKGKDLCIEQRRIKEFFENIEGRELRYSYLS